MMTLTPSQVVNDAEAFAGTFLKILDKDKRLVPLKWNRAQRHYHEHRTGRDLILKARQLGFSTYIQGEMFRRTVTGTRTTMTMAHDDETTQKLRRMADRFWENCRFGEIQPARKYGNATLATYPEFDSEAVIATAGSKEAGRGGTYTDFHGSEVAFWPNAEKIVAGAMQGGNPDIVLESTPNGAQGYFYSLCMEALRGDAVWQLHFYPWWWDSLYQIPLAEGEQISFNDEETNLVQKHNLTSEQIKWRRQKVKELRGLFVQEYPEDPISCFLTSGKSYFGDLANVFTAPLNTEYQEGHRYEAGLDWGQENDFTALIVLDITDKRMVDKLHINKLSWSEIRWRIRGIYERWMLKKIVAEANSIGSVNIEALQDMGIMVVPFETTNVSKSTIMGNLYEALHDRLKLQDWEMLKHELRTFVSTQLPSGVWRLAAEGDGHDDTVIALALAWEGANMSVELPENQPTQKSKWADEDRVERGKWRKY
jgi:hypothetical protein